MDKWNYKKVIIFTAVLLVVVTVFSVSFAYFTVEVREGPLFTTEGGVAPGTLPDISYTENVAGISLSKTYPMPDENGKKLKDTYTYTITNNDTEKAVDIIVAFEVLNNSTLEDNLVNYLLNDTVHTLGGTNTTTVTSSVYRASYIIDKFTLKAGESKTTNTKYWINENGTLENAQNKNWGGRVVVMAVFHETTAAESLIAKANDVFITDYSSGNTGEMYTFEHDEAIQTIGWSAEERRDYRYIGKTPNNWIKFNGEDWRIIGVFTVETTSGKKEKLIKLVRDESIGGIPWDMRTEIAQNGVNEWTSSSLKTLLNGNYFNTANSFSYTYTNSSNTSQTITIPKGLDETAKNQIEEVKWYLGGSSAEQNLGGADYYSFERGETTCVTTGSCSGEMRSVNTTAKVGLMYPSDYIYTYANGVDNTCYTDGYNCDTGQKTNGWLYNNISQWTISPYASSSYGMFYDHSPGYVGNSGVCNAYAVRPSVYLKSDIKIVSGDGASSETAYILG